MFHSIRRPRRAAFTLTELLVVLAILVVLLSLVTPAVMNFMGVGGNRATEATLRLVKDRLEGHWNALAKKAEREPIPAAIQATVDALAAGDNASGLRARVLYVKLRLKHAFPVNFAEVFTPYTPQFAVREYQTYLAGLGYSAGNYGSLTAEQQNAACLLMILTLGPGGGGANNDELSRLSTVLGTSPGGKEVRGLIDGYRTPLVLCRFPAGMIAPGAYTQTQSDPVDPNGLLSLGSWPNGNRTLAQNAIGHPLPAGQAYKMRPVVASAGPDKLYGLNLGNFSTIGGGDALDNKYTSNY